MKERVMLFIDGNNLHHSLVDRLGLPIDRLDVDYKALSLSLVQPPRHWQGTRYYIGEVQKESNARRYKNQQALLKSLRKHDGITCHLGKVEHRPLERVAQDVYLRLAMLAGNSAIPSGMAEELKEILTLLNEGQEMEKGVDVLLALDMLALAYKDAYDTIYLLTADTDFIPAVRRVRELGKKVFIVSPHPSALCEFANGYIRLSKAKLDGCWR